MKTFWICFLLSGSLFTVLLFFRLGLFDAFRSQPEHVSLPATSDLPDRESWMNIIQNGRKIGFSHTVFSKTEIGYELNENLNMRINTMGLVQDINLRTHGALNSDFSLSSFDFDIRSGRFDFAATGTISGKTLSIKTESAGDVRHLDIPIREKIYLGAALMDAVMARGLTPGERFSFQVFDPATMGQASVFVKVVDKEDIMNMGIKKRATRVSLEFKGVNQLAWIDENGEVLKEEGILGIILEKTMREDALDRQPVRASQDLTRVASVATNVFIEEPFRIKRLKVEISGINDRDVHLDGGRQIYRNHLLIIQKEVLTMLPPVSDVRLIPATEQAFLQPTPFIQSDHPRIRNLANKIVSSDDEPLKKVQKLVAWVHDNLEKRPVLSLPNALSTLENRVGDCNEHAVLLAALARAVGIPAKIEAGLVYLDDRFYYHAWNLLYLGRWITADSLFGQIPADATHIRFSSGAQTSQLDLM
ncbi:transglutaminase-like domain-containing protein, partial [Thermodesulfobacteriota bacterium]